MLYLSNTFLLCAQFSGMKTIILNVMLEQSEVEALLDFKTVISQKCIVKYWIVLQ